jgi:uncharacterized membrane protein YhdT
MKQIGEFLTKHGTFFKSVAITIWRFIVPLIYLFAWFYALSLAKKWMGLFPYDPNILATLSLPILFIGVLSKSTTWSIGGEKGIKGDTLGKYIKFGFGGEHPWDYTAYVSDDEKTIDKIKESEDIARWINKCVLANEKDKQKVNNQEQE